MPRRDSIILKALLKGLTTSIVFFLVGEAALRGVYFVRNAMVDLVPLPYAFGDRYGPLPPWLDQLDLLETDKLLIWKGKANQRRRYLHLFTPAWQERDRIALARRFLPSRRSVRCTCRAITGTPTPRATMRLPALSPVS